MIFPTFNQAINHYHNLLVHRGKPIHTEQWQSTDISERPEAAMRELVFESFKVQLGHADLDLWRDDLKPNLPWADLHFESERVSGEPINPGETWKMWPWNNSADGHRTQGEKFSHSYAERYWPTQLMPSGIRFYTGDLNDVVSLLRRQPLTRQAYLPVWFPEDTGVLHGERVPCTIGYYFIHRPPYLHVHYEIRSCDFVRHFRDDCYLTLRLLLWILAELKATSPEFKGIQPGIFSMFIGNLHCFEGDLYALKKKAFTS